MKKSLLIIAAVAMSFVACSKAEIQTVCKGMTLSANVADDNTKATIAKKEGTTPTKWQFKWEKGDVVRVTSPVTRTSYDFTYDGTSFKCETAIPEPGIWTAVYPASAASSDFAITMKSNVSGELGQDGTLASVMKNYLMGGSSEDYEQPVTTISINMTPKIAIVKITNNTGNEVSIDFTTNIPATVTQQPSYITSISKDGSAKYTASTLRGLTGKIPNGETYWYIAPANPNYTSGVGLKYGSKFYNTKKKYLDAGKVYNVTLGAI